jgi:hypothetical protein
MNAGLDVHGDGGVMGVGIAFACEGLEMAPAMLAGGNRTLDIQSFRLSGDQRFDSSRH